MTRPSANANTRSETAETSHLCTPEETGAHLTQAGFEVETAETVAARIRRALDVLPPERIVVAPDCGMKYLDRDTALGKLKAMVAGTDIVRKEIEGRMAGE